MQTHDVLVYAGTILVAAVIPGPGVLALVGCTLGRGMRAGAAYCIGLLAGDLIYLLLAVGGLAALAKTMGQAFFLVKLAGAAWLVWLGIQAWRSASQARGMEVAALKAPQTRRSAMLGLTTTLANPKTIVFYMGIMPMVVDMAHLTLPDVGTLAVVTVIMLVLALTPYVVLAGRARHLFRSAKATRRLARGSGAILVGAGAGVALS